MLFFAIVYLVEGIGQARVGIIYQPLTHYLKEIRLDGAAGRRLLRRPQFPVGHQAGLRPGAPISSRCSAIAARAT